MPFELTESQQYDLFFELAKNLAHPSRTIRVQTVEAISRVANRRCTNLLLDKLELEKDIFIKASLIRILGDIGTPNLLDPIDKYLHFAEPRIRANAIESIIKLKVRDKQEVIQRVSYFVQDENNRVAATALKEILEHGDSDFLPLLKLMLKGTDNQRKASAIWVVGELKLDGLLEDVVYALYSENYQVHSIANRVLKVFKEKSIPILFENLSMGDDLVKIYTFLFFAEHLDSVTDEQKALLLKMVEQEEAYVASFILKILYKLGLSEGYELLKTYLFHEDESLRRISVEGLPYYTSEEGSQDLLIRAAESELNSHLLSRLIHCFESFPSEESIQKMQEFLKHKDQRVVANCIEVLGKIGDRRLTQILKPYLENSNNRIMANAAVAVFRLGESKVLGHLQQALVSDSSSLRASAAFALGEIGSNEVVELLIQGLLDEAQNVRNHVVQGLLKQDQSNFQRLVDHLKGNESRSARQVLAEISNSVVVNSDRGDQIENLLDIYAEKIPTFEFPSTLEENEIEQLLDLLFVDDPKLQIYSIYVLGEHRIDRAIPRIICLLFERNDELVGEAMLALRKIDAKESLVFFKDIFHRLRGENMRLCSRIMQYFHGKPMGKDFFDCQLSAEHIAALQSDLQS